MFSERCHNCFLVIGEIEARFTAITVFRDARLKPGREMKLVAELELFGRPHESPPDAISDVRAVVVQGHLHAATLGPTTPALEAA